jgi:sulfatase maturation enzyme AslB (radical SAM superfamily)
MANQYCRHLSNAYRFQEKNGTLVYQPCCFVPFLEPVSTREELQMAQSKITDQVVNDKEKFCQPCLLRESSGYRDSMREKIKTWVPEDAPDGAPYVLEVQHDTECNAACIICGPHFSSLWRKENHINFKPPIQEMTKSIVDMLDLSRLVQIKFYGGEPLLTNTHLDLISKIPDPSKVSLLYSTNGSVFPNKETFDKWKQFKLIKISFSIDDIGERFTYIRYPLKWKRVESNLANILKNLDGYNKVIRLHTTVNPLNLWYIPYYEEWLDRFNQLNGTDLTIEYSPCYGNLGIINTPEELRTAIRNILPSEHRVIKLMDAHPFNPDQYPQFINFLKMMDKKRQTNWREIFKEISEYF